MNKRGGKVSTYPSPDLVVCGQSISTYPTPHFLEEGSTLNDDMLEPGSDGPLSTFAQPPDLEKVW